MIQAHANILVVDDIAENVQVLGNILKKQDYNVLAALEGDKALEIVNERPIDLVLLDISMPGKDGYEVARMIKDKEQTSSIPVIFLTARTETEDIVKGFQVGGADYITKPFQAEELLTRVNNQLLIKQQHEHILQQNKRLEELNATKDKFFSIIAHDLRNPFNLIINYSEMLINRLDTYSMDKKRQFLHAIYNSGQSAYKLLENLLTWSRSQIGTMEYHPDQVDMHTLVFETITFLQEEAKRKELHLKSFVPERFLVYADSNMLHIILRNLLGNAIKFTKSGGVVVIEAAEKQIQDKMWAEIAVKDNGIGLSADKRAHLFDLDNNTSTRGTANEGGTGLGLILCKEFVEKHGGSIWAEGEEGEGSTFRFTLPRDGEG